VLREPSRRNTALRELRRELDRQRIVWLEGLQATDNVVPSKLATGIRLVGGPT